MSYYENTLPKKITDSRLAEIKRMRTRLREETYEKRGVIYWKKNGRPVAPQVFHEAFCQVTRIQKSALHAPRRRKLLQDLSEAQNHHCCYCGCITTYQKHRDDTATIEHLKAQVHGGTDDFQNVVMACLRCNNLRKTLDPMTFFEGKLWKPERAYVLKLVHMMTAYAKIGDIRILQAMPCCKRDQFGYDIPRGDLT